MTFDELIARLADEDPQVRAAAAAALGRLGDRGAQCGACPSSGVEISSRVAQAALHALARLTISTLIDRLDSAHDFVTDAALASLAVLDDEDVLFELLRRLREERCSAPMVKRIRQAMRQCVANKPEMAREELHG